MAGLSALPQPGDIVGGKYLLESVVGRSELGALYGARHHATGRKFAIRWLPAADHAEAAAWAAGRTGAVIGCFHHPMVLSPVDVGWTRSALYLVIEWLDGETLSSRLRRVRTLPLAEAAALLTPCMRSLHEAHLANVVHGELRPGNIFIVQASAQQPEQVRLFDYSLAKQARRTPLVKSNGLYPANAFYLAPEQVRGAGGDRRSDVYAFGVILYRALTGSMPFAVEPSDQFARWVYAEDPPLPPMAAGLTPTMYRYLMRAMARDPERRFASCWELANALEALVRQPGLEEVDACAAPQGAAVERLARLPTMRLDEFLPAHGGLATNAPGIGGCVPNAPTADVIMVEESARAYGPTDAAYAQSQQPAELAGSGWLSPQPPAAAPQTGASVGLPPIALRYDAQELEQAQHYRRPRDRSLAWITLGFALVGAVPLIAYSLPPVRRLDDFSAVRGPALERAQGAASAQQPAAMSLGAGHETSSRSAAKAAPAAPDPVLDESDAVIAATLAAIKQLEQTASATDKAEPSGREPSTPTTDAQPTLASPPAARAPARSPQQKRHPGSGAGSNHSPGPSPLRIRPVSPEAASSAVSAATTALAPGVAVQTIPSDLRAPAIPSIPTAEVGAASLPRVGARAVDESTNSGRSWRPR